MVRYIMNKEEKQLVRGNAITRTGASMGRQLTPSTPRWEVGFLA